MDAVRLMWPANNPRRRLSVCLGRSLAVGGGPGIGRRSPRRASCYTGRAQAQEGVRLTSTGQDGGRIQSYFLPATVAMDYARRGIVSGLVGHSLILQRQQREKKNCSRILAARPGDVQGTRMPWVFLRGPTAPCFSARCRQLGGEHGCEQASPALPACVG